MGANQSSENAEIIQNKIEIDESISSMAEAINVGDVEEIKQNLMQG
jgi:hypothetical protein